MPNMTRPPVELSKLEKCPCKELLTTLGSTGSNKAHSLNYCKAAKLTTLKSFLLNQYNQWGNTK